MSIDVVRKYRVFYDSLSGAQRAWTIINAVALELGDGWGLITKSSGSNYQGYSKDVIINRDTGLFVDCLVSSETKATPAWQVKKATADELSRWHAPIKDSSKPVPAPDTVVTTDTLVSVGGRFHLRMQEDGNLVIYDNGKPIWDTNTTRK